MIVTISGFAGRDLKFGEEPTTEGNGTSPVSDTAIGVQVATGKTDWYLIKFSGDALVKASRSICKNAFVCVTGQLTFENWIDESQIPRSKPIVIVSDIERRT